MKTISLRLKAIAGMVKNTSVIDVGTDHALLPVYMCKNGLVYKVVACDVNKGPLEAAKKNIAKNGLNDVIETRQGSGIRPVLPGECETLVIAGMGGSLIIDLLLESIEKSKTFKQLILQPQRSLYKLRKFLISNGFFIKNELLVKENKIFYYILDVAPGMIEHYSEAELHFGKYVHINNPVDFRMYIEHEIQKYEKLISKHKAGELAENYLKMCISIIGGADTG